MNEPRHIVFVCHASSDAQVARQVTEQLERLGIHCWIAPRDVLAGEEFGNSIDRAISASKAVLLILSSKANSSEWVLAEVMLAVRKRIPLILYRTEEVRLSPRLARFLDPRHGFDGSGADVAMHAPRLAAVIRRLLPARVTGADETAAPLEKREDRSTGYVFISYVRSDADFVQKLRAIFESRKYGYWDYVVGSRDYHGTLYRELEERIDGAVAFMTIVSDDWRSSEWVASEFIYAREAKIPIFVIQAKKLSRPLPILLNLQTRIDMSDNFEQGAQVLAEELAKKGL